MHDFGGSSLVRHLRALWPLIVGLAVARAGIIAGCYGSYTQTDEGIWSDGATFVVIALFLALLYAIATRGFNASRTFVRRFTLISIAMQVTTLMVLGIDSLTGFAGPAPHFCFACVNTFFASGAMFYWLREAKGMSPVGAAVLAFGALAASEVELLACASLPLLLNAPDGVEQFTAAAIALVQVPLMARSSSWEAHAGDQLDDGDVFSLSRKMFSQPRFLVAIAIGIALLSVVLGLLRGFPSGATIPFTMPTRLGYAILTITLSAMAVIAATSGHKVNLTLGTFLAMEALACTSILLYVAFPHILEVGAITTTTCNALMVAFSFYITIAFTNEGSRDPYYYAMAGWVVWLGARSATRTLLIALNGILPVTMTIAIIGVLTVASTQITLLMFLFLTNRQLSHSESRLDPGDTGPIPLNAIMGLKENEDATRARYDLTRTSAARVGELYMLSEREVDVLTLYLMGHTQKDVADKLSISQDTVHAHIKRIYAKTDMHSRSEILRSIQG